MTMKPRTKLQQMAEEYAEQLHPESQVYRTIARLAYLAGFKAAREMAATHVGRCNDERWFDLITPEKLSQLGEEPADEEPNYPCQDCGAPRTKAEGGTTFTVCDRCWEEPVDE